MVLDGHNFSRPKRRQDDDNEELNDEEWEEEWDVEREMRKIRLALESKEDDEGEKATMAKGEDKLNKKQEMPMKLLQEAEGHVVTMELKNGDVYCGNLVESEDNWNCQLESVIATTKVLLNCISLVIFLIPAYLCHA